MISIYPTFYHTFQCKAHSCQYTCCQKWDVPIDDDTANFYNTLTTPLGEKLRHTMTADENGYSFVFPEDKPRCPLLTPNGLCQIILELGEDALSDVCRNHPRFYKYIEDLELCGVGLSCEAAVEGLLSSDDKDIVFTMEDNNIAIDNESDTILLDSDRDTLSLESIFHLLNLPINPELLRYMPTFDTSYYEIILNTYSLTDPVDAAWTDELQLVETELTAKNDLSQRLVKTVTANELALQRIYQYILYRQLDMLADYSLPVLLQYAKEATHFILLCTALRGNLPEQIRRWSEQMEYNEDNIVFLLNYYSQA